MDTPRTGEIVKQFKVYVPERLIRRLKHAAIETEQSLSAMVGEAIDRHLEALARGGKIQDRRSEHGS